jgi:hypothetical protein
LVSSRRISGSANPDHAWLADTDSPFMARDRETASQAWASIDRVMWAYHARVHGSDRVNRPAIRSCTRSSCSITTSTTTRMNYHMPPERRCSINAIDDALGPVAERVLAKTVKPGSPALTSAGPMAITRPWRPSARFP